MAVSLSYLAESSAAVVLSGIALIVVATAIITAAAAFERVLAGATAETTTTRATAVAAYLAAGRLTLAGALRISAPGTLAHVAGLDVEWARAGYLVVRIVGTQGAITGSQ